MLDILVPAAKDAIADSTTAAVERKLFGQVRSGARRGARSVGSSSATGHVNYNSPFRSSSNSPLRRQDPREVSKQARATHDFDEIILNNRADAEQVIDALFELISRFEQASVADLYELVGVTPSFVDPKWGWTDLRGAKVTRVRNGGYLLDLPKPDPLE
jgi:hypothetical protein